MVDQNQAQGSHSPNDELDVEELENVAGGAPDSDVIINNASGCGGDYNAVPGCGG